MNDNSTFSPQKLYLLFEFPEQRESSLHYLVIMLPGSCMVRKKIHLTIWIKGYKPRNVWVGKEGRKKHIYPEEISFDKENGLNSNSIKNLVIKNIDPKFKEISAKLLNKKLDRFLKKKKLGIY